MIKKKNVSIYIFVDPTLPEEYLLRLPFSA